MTASGGIISVAVRHLVANGVTGDALIAAIADMEAAIDTRSTGAKRQARYRERNKASQTVTSVTSDAPPPNEYISNPPPVSSEANASSETPTTPKSNGKHPPAVSAEQVIEAWNVMAGAAGVPKARLTPERRKKLNTFVRRHTIDDITEAIWAIPRSPFLCGENDRGWKAGIDFILQPSSFTKLIEGTYDRTH